MGINFPNAPAVGELHPTPPQAGVPQYRWDGTAWVAQSQDQLAFVKRTGDTMSGALTLPADPAAALQAATKQYVDAKSSLYISDNPPSSPPDGSMWWDSDNGLLYIRYNDGAGPSQWVQAVATPAIDSSVFVNKAGDTMGGALTLPGDPAVALQAAPKQYVDAVRAYAAPYDAIAYSGMQINGSMEVSQEVGSTGQFITAPATNVRPCDGWVCWSSQASGAMNTAVTRTTAANFVLQNCIQVNAINAFTAATSGDYLFLQQSIEGYRAARLNWGLSSASPLTYGFWFYPLVSGVIYVRVSNNLQDRNYFREHTVVAATWQWLTGTVPGDTTGTWEKTNIHGVVLGIGLGGKETTPAVPNAWGSAIKRQTTNSTNLMGTAGNVAYITGVVVLPGTQAPTAAQSPTIMRPYDQELMTCMRYWETKPDAIANVGVWATHYYKVVKRSGPTLTTNHPAEVTVGGNLHGFNATTSTTIGFDWYADARL